jgi:hypothetical protein
MSREDLYVVPDQDEVEEDEQVEQEPYKASSRETFDAILMGVSLGIAMAYGLVNVWSGTVWEKIGGVATIVVCVYVLVREIRLARVGSNDKQARGQRDGSRH